MQIMHPQNGGISFFAAGQILVAVQHSVLSANRKLDRSATPLLNVMGT
jgi:hypothetical protein